MVSVPLFKRLGLMIGLFGLKLFGVQQQVIHIVELGVVILLFVIGLEMKPTHLWELLSQIFGLGNMQALTCAMRC